MPIMRMHATLSVCIFAGAQALHQMERAWLDSSHHIESRLRRRLQYELWRFQETVEELKLLTPLDKRTTQILAVRGTLPDGKIDRFLREAEREIASGQDVVADDWFC